jgi:hypothetical protein
MSLKSSLYTLLKAVIGSETVVFADQNSPRPALPYWTIKVSVQRGIGIDSMSQGVDISGNMTIKGVREATVHLQRIGTGAIDSCTDLRDNLAKVTVHEQWQAANISIYDIGDVQDIPFPLDNSQLEARAVLDIFVRCGTSLLDNVGIIETVEADGDYITNAELDMTEINPDLAQEITVVL